MDKPPTKKKASGNDPQGNIPEHLKARLEEVITDILTEAMANRDLLLWARALQLVEAADAEPTKPRPIPHGQAQLLAQRLVAQAQEAIRFWEADPYDVARAMVVLVAATPFFFELPDAVDPEVTSRCWREPGHRDPAYDKACSTVEEAIKNKLIDPDRTTPEKVVRATFRALGADNERVRSWFR